MSFKKEVLHLLNEIDKRLIITTEVVKVLKDELRIQRDENQRLRDAFMAQDFEKFKTFRYETNELREETLEPLPEDLEQNAGEIL